jgi:hypothetical protein
LAFTPRKGVIRPAPNELLLNERRAGTIPTHHQGSIAQTDEGDHPKTEANINFHEIQAGRKGLAACASTLHINGGAPKD